MGKVRAAGSNERKSEFRLGFGDGVCVDANVQVCELRGGRWTFVVDEWMEVVSPHTRSVENHGTS
jgi:hypothetical protein